MNRVHIALLLTLVLIATGCGSVQKPEASFRSADVRAASRDGVQLEFGINVRNPNSFELPVSGANYALGLGGVQVMKDTAKPSASIPGKGSLPVTIPVSLSFEKVLAAERALSNSGGKIPYDFSGELQFAAGPMKALGQSLKVPIQFSGTLDFSEVLKDPAGLINSPAGKRVLDSIFKK